jgi:hypothetical protein
MPSFRFPRRFGSFGFGRLNPLERDPPDRALRTSVSGPLLWFVRERTATAPARPAKAAPPASNGVFARWATDATVRPAEPTLLAPLDAVSLTVSPTEPSVLPPLRERDCDCDRERLCDRGFELLDEEDRPDEDRPRDEPLLLAEPRELLLLLAELRELLLLLVEPRELLLLLVDPRELAVVLRPFELV